MFCPNCGVGLSQNSQFCQACGKAQSVTSGSTGAAAAVAPARIQEPKADAPKSNTSKWILSFLSFLVVCWAVWQVSLHAFGGHTADSTQAQPQPKLQTQSIGNAAFTAKNGGSHYYKLIVPAGAYGVSLKGHFTATGGSGNDIQVMVVNEDEYVNSQNGHGAKNFYHSGQVTQGSIDLALPSDAATYYVVFDNGFSFLSPKAVQANLELSYYTR
jgi:hypothetical protein